MTFFPQSRSFEPPSYRCSTSHVQVSGDVNGSVSISLWSKLPYKIIIEDQTNKIIHFSSYNSYNRVYTKSGFSPKHKHGIGLILLCRNQVKPIFLNVKTVKGCGQKVQVFESSNHLPSV